MISAFGSTFWMTASAGSGREWRLGGAGGRAGAGAGLRGCLPAWPERRSPGRAVAADGVGVAELAQAEMLSIAAATRAISRFMCTDGSPLQVGLSVRIGSDMHEGARTAARTSSSGHRHACDHLHPSCLQGDGAGRPGWMAGGGPGDGAREGDAAPRDRVEDRGKGADRAGRDHLGDDRGVGTELGQVGQDRIEEDAARPGDAAAEQDELEIAGQDEAGDRPGQGAPDLLDDRAGERIAGARPPRRRPWP